MSDMSDDIWLEVFGLEADVLTGVYSEETKLPQPLAIDIRARMVAKTHYSPDSPLGQSKSYMDLVHAVTSALPLHQHFTLVESVADHIISSLFLQDDKIIEVEVRIVKLAIAEKNERIGISLRRKRR